MASYLGMRMKILQCYIVDDGDPSDIGVHHSLPVVNVPLTGDILIHNIHMFLQRQLYIQPQLRYTLHS